MNSRYFKEKINPLLKSQGNIIDISGRDLDDILVTGYYGGLNCFNGPTTGYIELIVTHHAPNWIVQECLTQKKDIFLRAYQNGKWYDWEILDLTNDNNGNGPGITIEIVDRPHVHFNVTQSVAGFMSPSDKIKLDAIPQNSNNYIHPDEHSANMIVETSDKKFVSKELMKKINDNELLVKELSTEIVQLKEVINDQLLIIKALTSQIEDHIEIF